MSYSDINKKKENIKIIYRVLHFPDGFEGTIIFDDPHDEEINYDVGKQKEEFVLDVINCIEGKKKFEELEVEKN